MQDIEAVLGFGEGEKSSSVSGEVDGESFSSLSVGERDSRSEGWASCQATLKGWDVWRAMEGM